MHRNRPSTAPTYKSRYNESQFHSIPQSTSTTKIIQRQLGRSSHRNNAATNRSMRFSKAKYKSSQDIRILTKGLILDILPNKFKPLNYNEKHKSLRKSKSKSSVMLKIAASKPKIKKSGSAHFNLESSSLPLSTNSKKFNDLQIPLTSRSHLSVSKTKSTLTSRPFSARILKTRKQKINPKKKIMTPYEKYTLMDEVHELFFKLQTKEKDKQRLLNAIARNESDIEIEEGLRTGVLNDSLRQFPSNQHVVLTRAESNWLVQSKNIKDLYNVAVRDAQTRISTVDEFYTTARSTKIKECVIRLTKKAAKLRSKLNQHLKSLQFDRQEMRDRLQQVTEFEDMISGMLDIELLANNAQNKMDIIGKEIKLQTSLDNEYQIALNGLVNDLVRIYQSDGNIDQTETDSIHDIQSSLNEIQEFCVNNEEYEEDEVQDQDKTDEDDDFEQLMSPRSKSSKHEEEEAEEEKNEIYDVQNA